jgi:hypothetical protein
VPSQHDGKDGAIIADLGRRRKVRSWDLSSRNAWEQELRFWVRQIDRAQQIKMVQCGRIESMLARHWPEVPGQLALRSATLMEALALWGSPSQLANDPQASLRLGEFGGHYLTKEKIAAVIDGARRTVGVRMNPWEVREMKELAMALLEERRKLSGYRRELKRLASHEPLIEKQADAVGLKTAAVLWTCLGDPRHYGSAAAYRKAMGLNLAEHSSGKFKGQLHLSKRGPRLARKWLFFSALRCMRGETVKQWTDGKKARDGGKAMRAVIAVMRKLALAAWHVAVHETKFDARKLFRAPPPPRPGGRKAKTAKDRRGARPSSSQATRLGSSQATRLGSSQATRLGSSQATRLGSSQATRQSSSRAGGEEVPLPPRHELSAAPGSVKVPPHDYMGTPPSGRSTLTLPGSAKTVHDEVGGAKNV